MSKQRDWTVMKDLESYDSYYVGYDMSECSQPQPMTLKQANYIAREICGYVVKFSR